MIMCKVIKGTIEKFTPTMAKVSIHQVQHVCGGRKSDLTPPWRRYYRVCMSQKYFQGIH